MSEPAAEPEPLPGLEDTALTPASLERAVRRTIKALHDAGYLEEQHAARTALALELSQVIDLKHRTGKMSTIGNDARVLVELLDKIIPTQDTAGLDSKLGEIMAQWAAEVGASSE